MFEEDVEKVSKWFLKNGDENTYIDDEDFYIAPTKIRSFCKLISKEFPDLIGIPCMIDSEGVHFKLSDLEDAGTY